jgi:hypothetical protein
MLFIRCPNSSTAPKLQELLPIKQTVALLFIL